MATFEQAAQLVERELYDQALPILLQLADQGHTKAMLEIGLLYDKGRGVPQSTEFAVEWYRKAAETGDATAQLYMGIAYEDGEGVQQEINEAIRWYEIASNNGNREADVNLIRIYSGGFGVPLNVEKSIYYICRKDNGEQTLVSRMFLNDLAVVVEDDILQKEIKGNKIYLYESEAQEAARKCMEGKPNYTSSWIDLIDIIYLPETDTRIQKENKQLWSQCWQRRISTNMESRKIPCIEVRYGEEIFGRFGFLIEDYHTPVKPEKPYRRNPLINEAVPDINKLRLIKLQLENLKKKYDKEFTKISSFNPLSRIKIHIELPKMQETFKEISDRLATINRFSLSYEDHEFYNKVEDLYNELKEDLF